jgi:flagellar biosynthesis protein FlhG
MKIRKLAKAHLIRNFRGKKFKDIGMNKNMKKRSSLRLQEISYHYLTRPEINKNPLSLKLSRVISISSGKGGVGKTNVVINLAFALAQLGKKVLVLDADFGLPNIHTFLGLTPKYSIGHFFKLKKNLWEILINGPKDIKILPGETGDFDLVNLDENQKIYLLKELEPLVKTIDILLIDTASGLSSNVLFFNMMAGNTLIIITPEGTSLKNAQILITELFKKNKRRFEILVNCVRNSQEAKGVFEDLSKNIYYSSGNFLSLDYLGFVPFDDRIQEAIRNQRAVLDMYPESSPSCSFMNLANTMLEKIQMEEEAPDNQFLSKENSQYYFRAILSWMQKAVDLT